MRRRFLAALTLATVLLAGQTTAVAAYEWNGAWFGNADIGDGRLSVCFEAGTPVDTHRGGIIAGIRYWRVALNLSFDSLGLCGNDGSEIEVLWDPVGTCHGSTSGGTSGSTTTFGAGQPVAWIRFNSNCGAGGFNWDSNAVTPPNKWDSFTVAAHESGHALGLAHENQPDPDGHNGRRDLMDLGAGGCGYGTSGQFTQDDVNGMRARYAGLAPTFNIFPAVQVCFD